MTAKREITEVSRYIKVASNFGRYGDELSYSIPNAKGSCQSPLIESEFVDGGIKTKTHDYVVTYKLSKRGRYVVGRDGSTDNIPTIIDYNTKRHVLHVCFLPEEWGGKRVSRTVRKP
jgi:hypothetical protein